MDDAPKAPATARPEQKPVVVFGGSGFLGRRIVRHLLDRGSAVRAASRHPDRAEHDRDDGESFSAVKADILNREQLAEAVSGGSVVINAVSLYSEHGDATFERVHVEAAAELAAAARDAGADRYIQISGIGSDPHSGSGYIRARGRGEEAVAVAFPGAIIVRPAVMTGSDDAFLTTIVRLVRLLPGYPLFGRGDTRLQPAFVEDVAEAIARLASVADEPPARLFELGGPRVHTYRNLVREVGRLLGVRTRSVPVPFPAWRALAAVAEHVPGAPLTRNQVELMEIDNVADAQRPGFRELGIEPHDIDVVVRAL